MRVMLPYGRDLLPFEAPGESEVLALEAEAPLPGPEAAVLASLHRPVGGPGLAELARAKKARDACVVISDHTRPVPNRLILPPLLSELEAAGVPSGAVTLLIANGMHRPTTAAEKEELVGRAITRRYRVVDHRAADRDALAPLEAAGVPVSVNRAYLGASLKILTGFIEPHFMAGFSGGRKSVCPGIAGLETLRHFHGVRMMASPAATAGRLSGNPCHLFALRVAERAGVDFIVNVTLNRRKEITGVFSGPFRPAHLAGTRFCRRRATLFFTRPADIVVTTGGGYPLDRDFYQVVKGLAAAFELVRPGGVIICAARCVDGVGSAEFRELLAGMETPARFMAMLRRPGFFRVDQWEVQQLVRVLERARVKIRSEGLTGREAALCRAEPVGSVSGGLADACREIGGRPRVAVAPDGPYAIYRARAAGGGPVPLQGPRSVVT